MAKGCNCFRAPGFLAYMREMSAIYAATIKPYAIWIDDEILAPLARNAAMLKRYVAVNRGSARCALVFQHYAETDVVDLLPGKIVGLEGAGGVLRA